ncbi:Succinyl-CoA:(R)-benzylsuccinate CoA-transferase subunit BbsF [Rhodobacteraceae bacterium THAF1]|uniref:CaiB/BaiF CoA transferase family protein n=1 Tax=Palleronia sp. THAF1 TaxID=2587842 RepID=UPI000F412E9F|nr:CaiB/BaiF CoA-transferase family protein [Palleronia sp. THAF1]QFU08132.1 Succinyl-CoA:(R)-benzylsuccinate CoA-transferase subunit BbsF [Palleronia sp. THAF1]VDC28682.1 Succinyl-CoA:(R)-benzylsuccinate CoA-transferase subunit BbsF [Rhodobacteraceae bacterium THAF1]
MTTGPLYGLLVLSIEQAVAAPYCTARLADAGARVIKVERPEGDFARGYDQAAAGDSSYFVWLNRGKESLCLDLNAEADRALLLHISDRADVVVQNLKPGTLDGKGLGPDDLRARNPRLITCSISGYGESGPFAQRKAYDLLIQAESGLCSINGGPSEPARVGISVVDIATGAAAHAAILEALIGRGITGAGTDIRVSMFDVIADWLTVPYLHAAAGQTPKRMGLAHPSISPYGVFTTQDDQPILLSIQNDREWRVLVKRVLDRPDLADDPETATNTARVTHRARVDTAVGAAIARHDADAIIALLSAADIAFARVNDMNSLIAHPHLTTATVTTPGGANVSLPAPAPLFNGVRRVRHAHAPALNAHSETIRAEFRAT